MMIKFDESNPAYIAFRAEVRAFIEENCPRRLRNIRPGQKLTKRDYLEWHRIVAAKGWAVPSWPIEYGGNGWDLYQRQIWNEELAAAATIPLLRGGISMLSPVIYTFGTEAQKQRFLGPTRSGEILWCQGFSEPGAGSDLASLQTRAERRGDVYVVRGQKTWTSLADIADWIFCLVRTDPTAERPQDGISLLLIDMQSRGIEIQPIPGLIGDHPFCHVFFDDVEVPVENRIHEENAGWTCAKFLLGLERSGIANVMGQQRELDRLKSIVACAVPELRRAFAEEGLIRRLAEMEIELTALGAYEARFLANALGSREEACAASTLKILGSELQQRIADLGERIAGPDGITLPRQRPEISEDSDIAAATLLWTRRVSIYGGANEVQRNIIAKMLDL